LSKFYVSPTGAGDGSGSNVANAATLTNLNQLIGRAGPGGEVLLLADQGVYSVNKDLQIAAGGATIRGIDAAGNAMQAVISAPTASIFVLRNGADDLTFRDLKLTGTTGGYGALRIGGDIHDLAVDNVDAANVRTFLGVGASPGQTASVSGLTVRHSEVIGYTSAAILIAGNSSDVLLEDIVLDGQNRDPSSFMFGVHFTDTAHDVVVRNVTASNNIYTGAAYWNGDGFASEEGVYNLRMENTVARNNGDAGYDLKSTSTTLENALAEGNQRNFRFWGDVTATHITGNAPHVHGGSASQAQVWLAQDARATINSSIFTDSDPHTTVFEVEGGGVLTLVGATVNKAQGALLQNLGTGAVITVEPAPPPGVSPQSVAPPLSTPALGDAAGEVLKGGVAADELHGGVGDDYLRGDGGDDLIFGGAGFDDINGNTGRDTESGGDGDDWVVGGQNDDSLYGDGGADIVYGNLGSDTAEGGVGDDIVRGGQGDDSVSGGGGNDFVSGDRGADTMSGGPGADVFNFFHDAGRDRIIDFSAAEDDRLRIEGSVVSIQQSGLDTIVDLGGGDQVVLVGVTASMLPDNWLVLV
jgi:Ca2+-binding RTX toxin-like protein